MESSWTGDRTVSSALVGRLNHWTTTDIQSPCFRWYILCSHPQHNPCLGLSPASWIWRLYLYLQYFETESRYIRNWLGWSQPRLPPVRAHSCLFCLTSPPQGTTSLVQRPTWRQRWWWASPVMPRWTSGAAVVWCCTCSMAATPGPSTSEDRSASRSVRAPGMASGPWGPGCRLGGASRIGRSSVAGRSKPGPHQKCGILT